MLGAYADRHGRKASLMISIVLMTIGTLAIAVMPTYETIGILAPIAVLVARLLQGFSAGGEFGSSTAFLVEHAPDRRGFIASWQFASQGLGQVLSSAFGVGLISLMTPADMNAWGWRIPFLFGVLVGPVGIYIRNHLEDATAPPAAKQRLADRPGVPASKAARDPRHRRARGIDRGQLPHRLHADLCGQDAQLPPIVGYEATLAGGIAVTLLTPIAGMISDRIGRTTHMIAINVLLLLSITPAFLLLTRNPTPAIIILAVLWLATLKALYFGPLAALMSELLPAATRATGLGLGYNIGVTVFGGMGPVTMTWLGSFAFIGDLSPAWYLTLVGFLSLSALITIRRTSADKQEA